MNQLNMTEASAKLKMPLRTLAKWRDEGQLDGVDHPAFETKRGGGILYAESDVDAVAKQLPKNAYFRKPDVKPEFWSRKLIMKHGVSALLSCAVLEPVRYRARGNDFYLIEATSQIKNGSDSARGVLGKSSKPLAEVERIESKHDFPGIQFTITRVE